MDQVAPKAIISNDFWLKTSLQNKRNAAGKVCLMSGSNISSRKQFRRQIRSKRSWLPCHRTATCQCFWRPIVSRITNNDCYDAGLILAISDTRPEARVKRKKSGILFPIAGIPWWLHSWTRQDSLNRRQNFKSLVRALNLDSSLISERGNSNIDSLVSSRHWYPEQHIRPHSSNWCDEIVWPWS